MAWISMSASPNLKEAEFNPKDNIISIRSDNYNITCRLWLRGEYGCDPLLFLYGLRFAVDEAIKFNLDRENQKQKEEN